MKLTGQITSLNMQNCLSKEPYITIRVNGCIGISRNLSIQTKDISDYKLGQLVAITVEVIECSATK